MTSPQVPADHDGEQRALSNCYCLWALCGNLTCRKAQTCRGDATACFGRSFPLLSQDALTCAFGLGIGRQSGLTLAEAYAALRPDQRKGWDAWRAAVWRARRGARANRAGRQGYRYCQSARTKA
jgi:hypothetical protein